MKNKIILIFLIISFVISASCYAEDVKSQQKTTDNQTTTVKKLVKKSDKKSSVGKQVTEKDVDADYTFTPTIEDLKEPNDKLVMQGSVEKNIDVTLEECIKFALGNNPKIREAIEEISASDARVKQAWSSFFPTLGWSTNVSRNKSLLFSDAVGGRSSGAYTLFTTGQISVNQMIYDFGITQNTVTIKKLGYKTAQEALTSVVNDVIKETKDKYYALLYAYENLRVKEDNVQKYELFYNQAKAFYEIGVSPKVDVTIAEVNLSNAKMLKIQAQTELNVAIAQLNNVMGIPYQTKFNISERLVYAPCDISLEEAMKIAEESRPDLKIAKLQVETSRQQLKLAKKEYAPKLSFQGNLGLGGSEPASTWGYSYGGYLDFTNVNVMKINQDIKEAKALYSKQKATSDNTQLAITLEIQTAYYNLIQRQNQIPVAFLGLKQAKENYEISFGRYRVGEGNPIELKDAQTQYLASQLAYYNALYQFNSAKANLEKAIGKNLMYNEEVVNLTDVK